ncbi:MAG: amino acid adenylation domain-containing protein, partial [bacterium]|nr:amino acid adenylation domain-containing protein [bacterium]
EEFWKSRFDGDIPVLNLVTDYPRPAAQNFDGDTFEYQLNQPLTEGLKEIADEHRATLFMILLTVYNVLLSRYTGQEDIVVGSVIAGRPHVDLESIVGIFVNTLAMRNHPVQTKPFTTFLDEVKNRSLESYENQDYQFEELVETLDIKRDVSRNPLFDTMFTLEVTDTTKLLVENLVLKAYEFQKKISKFDLSLEAAERENCLILNFEYCTRLFKRETIEAMGAHFANIVEHIIRDPEIKIGGIDLLTEQEKRNVVYEFNEKITDYPADKTLQQQFEEQVEKTPTRIALVFRQKELTYRELNQQANRLALMLKERGVGSATITAIMLERSLEMITGLLGILKAGGAYLPIDTAYPKPRINHILNDSAAPILVTRKNLPEGLDFAGETLLLEENTLTHGGDTPNPQQESTAGDLAYVIYTSGTTGNPKGVLVEHQNVVAYIHAFWENFKITADDVLLQLVSYSFDAFVEEVYPLLLRGAKLVIPLKDEILDIRVFVKKLAEKEITIISCSPLLVNELNKYAPLTHTLHTIISGGDVLKPNYMNRLIKQSAVYNTYGPTETSVCAAYYRCLPPAKGEEDYNIPIGSPISNYQVYILDPTEEPVPIGVSGEIHISGHGVARGYLNRPEITQEKFIENPYKPGETIYKSGDLGRWLPDGNIEFLGRIDRQIKIRGYRIELGEIETKLAAHDAVKETVVIDRDDSYGDKYLCAYFTADEELTPGELISFLQMELPEYMVPSYFIQLDKLPLTANGKVNKKKLPAPEGQATSGVEYTPPRDDMEKKLAETWQEILKIEKVGIDDNFFRIGGHSLKAAVLTGRIYKEFNTRFPLSEIFKIPTIRGIAKFIKGTAKSIYSAIEAIEKKEYYPVSSAQKRLYALQQFQAEETTTNYNMSQLMIVDGPLDSDRLEQTFKQLIARHESLRTSFKMQAGEPIQQVHDYKDIEFSMTYSEIEAQKERIDDRITAFIRPFQLSKAPLIRVGIIKIKDAPLSPAARPDNKAAHDGPRHGSYFVMVDMHHIISDGTSIGVVICEFIALYEGKELPELRLQYKDYALWQQGVFNQETIRNQMEFWKVQFPGEIPVLEMPLDYSRPPEQSFDGENYTFSIDENLTRRLKKLANSREATLYMTLLAIYNIMLARYTGQEDIVVGTPVAGRPHPNLENITGMFVNTLALRNYPASRKSYIQFLEELKDRALRSFENQDYPFEELVDVLEIRRDLSRNPLFDTMFILQNIEVPEIELENLTFKHYEFDMKTAKFDFTLTAAEEKNKLDITIEYCTALFKKETMAGISRHYINIAEAVAKTPSILLSQIDMLTAEEKQRLLIEFNDTAAQYPGDKTIHELFEEQAEKTPDTTAIARGRQDAAHREETLTYSQLNAKANRLASQLRKKGVGTPGIVALLAERSPEILVGIMAVLKAGAAFLPLDTGTPDERIDFIFKDSNTNICLTQTHLRQRVEQLTGGLLQENIITLDETGHDTGSPQKTATETPSATPPPCPPQPEDTAYIIYTSGTTGNPKGVMVTHRNVVNYITWAAKVYVKNEKADFPLYTSISFDLTITSIFTPLVTGNTLVVYGGSAKELLLEKILEDNRVDVIKLTPAHLSLIKNKKVEDTRVKRFIVGGEELGVPLSQEVSETYQHRIEIYNEYGPTETTVGCMIYRYHHQEAYNQTVPIGKPSDNTRIYILDKHLNPVPTGAAGELYVGGDGVTKGYLNRPDLTAERFGSGPPEAPVTDGIYYRTGDLARWLPGEIIEFIGRIDLQVKIRGFRIELAEIEMQIAGHEAVKEVVVVDRVDDTGYKYLAAYIISEREFTPLEMREYIANELPDYMIPSYFVPMETFPLGRTGKIDRKALPEPKGLVATGTQYEAPQDDVEKQMATAWSEILGHPEIGVQDNFFTSGGDSIKAIQVAGRLRKYGLKMEVKDLFRNPTIRQLRRHITRQKRKARQETVTGELPLTPIQHWYFNREETVRHHWNQSFMLYKPEGFDEEILKKVFEKWQRHHDALRMHYKIETPQETAAPAAFPVGNVIQNNRANEENYRLRVITLPGGTEPAPFISEESTKIQRSLDINNGPVLATALFKTGEGDHLLIVIHHLVVDGVSWRILMEDFTTGCEQALKGEPVVFQEKTDSFKEWARQQQEYAESKSILRELEYWKKIETAHIPPLPRDRQALTDREEDSRTITMKLTEEETGQLLKEAGRAYATEINDLLLTALGLAVKEWTEEPQILVQLEGHGREPIIEDIDITRTVGWFTATYPVILDMTHTHHLAYQIRSIKENLRRVPNKGIGYGILKYLTPEHLKKKMEYRLKPCISFNYLGQADQDVKTTAMTVSPISTGEPLDPASQRGYTLDINGIVMNGRLEMGFNYNKNEYDAQTIDNLKESFRKNLVTVIKHCLQQKETVLTPSDLGNKDLTIDELEEQTRILTQNREQEIHIREIYPLTPMQEGMLFHTLMDNESPAYFEQSAFTITGTLDIPLFEKSFKYLIQRYDILRTAFLHDKLEKPLQAVLKEVAVNVPFHDISGKPQEEQAAFIKTFKENDKSRGFHLNRDLLMRIAIIKNSRPGHTGGESGSARYQVVWSFHHILMDGWCLGIIIDEFFQVYKTLKAGGTPDLPQPYAYGDYIRWLERQEPEAPEHYWKKALENCEDHGGRITMFAESTGQAEFKLKTKSLTINENVTNEITRLASQYNHTLNTMFQVIWGLLLQRYSRTQDVVFGTIVSGRTAKIEGIEKMVGLFINTIPVRITADENKTYLQLIQQTGEDYLDAIRYEYYPLAQTQSLTPLKQDLLDHIMVFENYPMEKEIEQMAGQEEMGFKLGEVEFFEQTNYDFDFTMVPGKELTVIWSYNSSVYPEESFFDRMAGHF